MRPNFNLAKELAERSEKDWKYGAASVPGVIHIPLAERTKWLPKGETQFDAKTDFTDCASRSPDNHLEALFTYHFHNGMREENKQWFRDKGFVVTRDGREVIEFSDRFTAILSGTTREGNSLKAPIEAIRKFGLIPKSMLPKEDWMDWDDYYDKSKITQAMRDIGAELIRRFPINYEQVPLALFDTAIQNDMLGVALYAWPVPVNGVYPRIDTNGMFTHAALIYGVPKYQIFDNYEDWNNENTQQIPGDFTKTLAPDYIFYEVMYRVYVAGEPTIEEQKKSLEEQISFLQKMLELLLQIEWIKKLVENLKKNPQEVPVIPIIPHPPSMPNNLKIQDTAIAMLGKDASPKNLAPKEVACAESVSNILHSIFPDFPENIVGTDALFAELKRSSHFVGVLNPKEGTIVVSPRTPMINGHTGIYTHSNTIASNDSHDGLFKENYTRESWRRTFIAGRGLKGYLFDAV